MIPPHTVARQKMSEQLTGRVGWPGGPVRGFGVDLLFLILYSVKLITSIFRQFIQFC